MGCPRSFESVLVNHAVRVSNCRWLSDMNISEVPGSEAKYLRYSEIVRDDFITNLLLSNAMKEFRESVNIWQR